MKKSLWVLLLVGCFFLSGCPPHPKYQFNKIAYKAFSRGSSESIVIEKNQNNYAKARLIHLKNGKEVLNKRFGKFRSLYKVTKNITVEEIDKIKVPSKKYQFDGAMLTTVEFSILDKVYRSSSFDHDNPPEELKPLIDYLKSLVK